MWLITRQELADALSGAGVALVAGGRPVESGEALADLVLARLTRPAVDWRVTAPAVPGAGETLAVFVAAARAQRGLSLREAEKVTGIANAHLSQIETGAIGRPGIVVLARMAVGYGIPLREFVQRAGCGTDLDLIASAGSRALTSREDSTWQSSPSA